MKKPGFICRAVSAALLAAAPLSLAHAEEARSLEELRNTVINLLQALVDQGVMSRDKAEQLVRTAQEKADADAAAHAAADQGAVRVTYVPEIVREQIRGEVAKDLRADVTAQVLAKAREEQWGVPGAMPDWVGRFRWFGDLRIRAQADLYAPDNLPLYLDFQTVNDRGGIGRAGAAAFTNVAQDRYRLRVQARLGAEIAIGGGVYAGARLVTGNLRDPVSANQTLGQYGGKFTPSFDQAYLRWDVRSRDFTWFQLTGGRFANPWYSTDLVFDRDLGFEGVAATGRWKFAESGSNVFMTLGAHPLEEVELSTRDKWLFGGQLGVDLRFGDAQRLRLAAAYYDFHDVQGRQNAPDSTLLDFTAPRFLQRGNTLFDIRNDLDTSTNLFALAGKYQIADLTLGYEVPVGRGLRLSGTADWVRNVGWKQADVLALTGSAVERKVDGYQIELALGHPDVLKAGAWRAFFSYRYVERDAVLDAFTDSDFHLGGTDAKGYTLGVDYGVARNTWLRLRYLTADEIDGVTLRLTNGTFVQAPFGVDSVQLDLNAQF